MTRACIFDGNRPLTLEHAIPKWTHSFLPGQGQMRHQRGATQQWHNAALDITVKRVCAGCNDGWMSRLEDRTRPLISGPIQGQQQVWTPRDQRVVATWAYKTALMCGLASGQERIPVSHFKHLHKKHHPPGRTFAWATSIGAQPGEAEFKVAGIESRMFHLEGSRGTKADGYALTLSVGYLAFQIFGIDNRQQYDVNPPAVQGVAPSQYEVRIWPQQVGPITWPPSHGFDRETLLDYANRFTPST